ncbi:unnamed protein product [Pylaiella littoralis]
MARRSEEYARLNSGGGYTQSLTIGKGFSGAERSAAKQGGGSSSSRGGGTGSSSGISSAGTMNAYARHQELIRNYHRYHLTAEVPSSGAIEAKGLPGQRRLTDDEALRRQHRFVRDREEDNRAHQARGLEGAEADPTAWEVRMATKYYKLLFKEYALADLSRYREDRVGLRWRTEKDVVSGKGQFACGALRCQERRDLHSYELNFKYKEAGEVKNELVKVRVCPQCARKLFRKKIEALRRQREAELLVEKQREADRERRRKRAMPSLSLSPDGVGGCSVDANAGDSNVPRVGSDGDVGGGSAGGAQGHDLVRQAVAAAGSGRDEGTVAAAAHKRSRPSRWGDIIVPPSTAAAESGQLGGSSGSGLAERAERAGVGAEAEGGRAVGSDESRKAWAGELQRDRMVEDEMDDYLSSLLL